jgi:hypothetical protein
MQLNGWRARIADLFHKRSQLLAGAHNETPSIAAMRVNNPGCSPLRIDG